MSTFNVFRGWTQTRVNFLCRELFSQLTIRNCKYLTLFVLCTPFFSKTRNEIIINALKTVLVAQYTFWWIPLKVHSQELLSEQIDCHIWNLHGFFTQCTNFHTSRARCSWKQAIVMNHSKNEILGETPLDMTWIDGFPLFDNIFLYDIF